MSRRLNDPDAPMSAQLCLATITALVMAGTGALSAVAAEGQPDPQLAAQQAQAARLRTDWAQLLHYRDEDLKLPPPNPAAPRVIFMGDSITASWHLPDLGLSRLDVLIAASAGRPRLRCW